MMNPWSDRAPEWRVASWLIKVNGPEAAYVKAFERAHGYQLGRDWGPRNRSTWRPFWQRVCRRIRQWYMLKRLGPKPEPKRRMRPLDTRCKH